jgi:hypothetical protein
MLFVSFSSVVLNRGDAETERKQNRVALLDAVADDDGVRVGSGLRMNNRPD